MKYTVIPRAVVLCGRHIMLVRSAPGVLTLSAGRWHLPGGAIRSGETPQKSISRAVNDRSGLRVQVGGCLDALVRRGPDPETGRPAQLLHLFFLCTPAPDADPGLLPGGGGPELSGSVLADQGVDDDPGKPAGHAGDGLAGHAGDHGHDGHAGDAGHDVSGPQGPGARRRKAPPLGADWGWTDFASGLAALRHDVVGPEAIRHIEDLAGRLPPKP